MATPSRPVLIALLAVLLVAASVAVALSRSRSRSSASAAAAAPVISVAWHAVGEDVEPWSGLGLGEGVRRALDARGVVVTDDALSHKVTYVLAGTVGRKGERSEVGMQLVRVRDSTPVWAATFWRDRSDLETLASDLALAVAQVVEAETSRTLRLSP